MVSAQTPEHSSVAKRLVAARHQPGRCLRVSLQAAASPPFGFHERLHKQQEELTDHTSLLQVLDAALSAQPVGLVTQEQYKRKLAQLQQEGGPTEAPKVSACCLGATFLRHMRVSGTAVDGPLRHKELLLQVFVGR